VATAYKKKADKVRPVDPGETDGSKPGGCLDWLEKSKADDVPCQLGPYSDWITPKFSDIQKGSRLTEERIKDLIVGDSLWPKEKELFINVLYNREKALAFDFSHIGKVKPDVAPPQIIKTVEHKAWQVPGFPIPKALLPVVIRMLQERLKNGILEYGDGPYRNPWFLVRKKNGKYRLINAAMEINKRSIRDANLPPSVDEFSEEFAGCQMASMIDLFSGYDQIELDVRSRDLTGFQTPIGLLRMTTLPQGATNSVAQFVRIVTKILEDLIPEDCLPFLDDIGVKGPLSTYGEREVLLGIRQFVMEHVQSLDKTLVRLERAGCTIGPKSQFCMDGINIVGFVCGAEGRNPDSAKVIKILEWKACLDVGEARAFIGVCVYYRIWIKDFSTIAEPIYYLFKKGVPWNWGSEQDLAMSALKTALTSAPALVKIIYTDEAGEIILAVDASLKGWGAVLMQLDAQGKRHPSRYESGLWNQAERNYDATKRECRGVLKALRKVRYWLYGVHFVLETDASVLVAQLNRSATDLPGALVTRWIAYIQLFDFEVRHVPGSKHTAADGLSRRPRTESDNVDEANEVDIEDFIDAEINAFSVAPIVVEGENLLEDGYSEESWRIARYLTTLKKPDGLSRAEFRNFKRKALQYAVLESNLYRRAGKNVPQRLVIDSDERKAEILTELHDDCGHKGRESTYRRVSDRYYWENCYDDVRKFVASCERCQLRDPHRLEEALYPTWSSALFEKIGLDVVQMPPCEGKNYLVVAREDLSGWPEARALSSVNSAAVAKFLWEDVVCRHGCFGRLVVDGGSENKGYVAAFTKKYGIERVQASAYNPAANGMVERGHKPIVDALAKMTDGGLGNWVRNLSSVLFADRTSTHQPTGKTPFRVVYGREAILPIELKFRTWRILEWEKVRDRAELLALRTRQLMGRDEDLEEVRLRKQRKRMEGKDSFDRTHQIHHTEIKKGDLVLRHDSIAETDMSRERKLSYKWLGPYRVQKAIPEKGTYILEEFDGTALAGTYSGNRLKKFVERQRFYIPVATEQEDSVSSEDDEERSEGSESAEEPEEAGIDDLLETQPRRSGRLEQKPRIHWDVVNRQGGLPSKT
jgi:hypothetical protein